jgi:fructose-1,6-bisphosphatase I
MTDAFLCDRALDRDCTTLSRHVLQQLKSFSADAQDLSALMSRIALAGSLPVGSAVQGSWKAF